jgi:tetratricopeptide (TPR) repeat protein
MVRKWFGLLLLLVAAPASADWHEASTEHFVVYSELAPDKLKDFAGKLERFDRAMRLLRNVPDEPVGPANRVTIYMVDDRDDVGKLVSDRFVAGFYVPRAGGSLAIVPRKSGDGNVFDLSPQAILLHEYTHHLMWSFSPNTVYPSWYIEGFAEALATVAFEKDGSILFGNPPLYRGYGLMSGNALPVDKLMIADTLRLNADQREGLYGRGWLLSHYLLFSGQRADQLTRYLNALNEGKPLIEAAAAFGDLKTLDRELEKYKMGKFRGFRIVAGKVPTGEVTLRRLTAGEAATMTVRVRSKVGVNAKTAPGTYERAKKAAAPYPNDRGAQLVLAEAAYDAKDYAVSEAAADRAIAADAKAVDGYVYKAMSQMALAAKAGDTSPKTWASIRKVIAAGNKIDPNDPEPLILYFRSFVEGGTPPTENAKRGLMRAFELAPQDPGLRFNTAAVVLRDGDKARARAMLAPLAYQPHGQGMAGVAAQLIAMIDKGEIDKALGTLDAKPEDADGEDANEK